MIASCCIVGTHSVPRSTRPFSCRSCSRQGWGTISPGTLPAIRLRRANLLPLPGGTCFQIGVGDVQTALLFQLVERFFLYEAKKAAAFDVGHHRRKQPEYSVFPSPNVHLDRPPGRTDRFCAAGNGFSCGDAARRCPTRRSDSCAVPADRQSVARLKPRFVSASQLVYGW